MTFKIFSPPDGIKSWSALYIGQLPQVLSFEGGVPFRGYDDFELVIPYDDYFAAQIGYNSLIKYSDGVVDIWLIVQRIEVEQSRLVLGGYNLSYILSLRVSENQQGQEDDAVSGTTAQCIEHFLDNNFISPANSKRAIPMVFDRNSVTGLSDDAYLAKRKPVNEIINELCEAAGIGYTIVGGLPSAAYQPASLRLRLLPAVDKSKDQTERAVVVFGVSKRNVKRLKFRHDITNEYNAAYATGAGVTVPVYRSTEPEGFERRECAIDVDVETSADISKYALYDLRDNVREETYEVEPAAAGFGVEYFVGDIVTIRDDNKKQWYSGLITDAGISMTEGSAGKSLDITVGAAPPKLLNRIISNASLGIQKKSR